MLTIEIAKQPLWILYTDFLALTFGVQQSRLWWQLCEKIDNALGDYGVKGNDLLDESRAFGEAIQKEIADEPEATEGETDEVKAARAERATARQQRLNRWNIAQNEKFEALHAAHGAEGVSFDVNEMVHKFTVKTWEKLDAIPATRKSASINQQIDRALLGAKKVDEKGKRRLEAVS